MNSYEVQPLHIAKLLPALNTQSKIQRQAKRTGGTKGDGWIFWLYRLHLMNRKKHTLADASNCRSF